MVEIVDPGGFGPECCLNLRGIVLFTFSCNLNHTKQILLMKSS